MAKLSGKTFTVDVPDVGAFECAVRDMRTALAISAEFNRLTEGQDELSPLFEAVCEIHAYLKVMIKHAPDDWDLDGADPDSEGDQRRILIVYDAIRAAERTFRSRATGDTKKPSEGT
jgi:hypothetical protein